MKNKYLILLITTISLTSNAQSFLNGSFENTTAPNSCTYNNSVSDFNLFMSNIKSIGEDGIDIHIEDCYIPNVTNGIYAIGLGNNDEGVSMELSEPLVSGDNYTITFDAYSQTEFGAQGNLIIGVSNEDNVVGIPIYEAVTIVKEWTSYTYTFAAPNNGMYITVMPDSSNVSGSWNIIDNFSFANTLSISSTENISEINIYPNPSSDFLLLSGLKSKENYKIYNSLGLEVNNGFISDKEKIDIQNLSEGIYFLKIEDRKTMKFIKE